MAMLFEFEDADYEPISRFSLAWRWTRASHAEFPASVLDCIRPLRGAKAAIVNSYVIQHVHARWPRLGVIDSPSVTDRRRIDASEMDDSLVQAWLVSLPIAPHQTVIVSWDANTAVSAPFAVVAEYWSNFYYADQQRRGHPAQCSVDARLGTHESVQFGSPVKTPTS